MAFVIFLMACPTLYFIYKWGKQKDEELYAKQRVEINPKK